MPAPPRGLALALVLLVLPGCPVSDRTVPTPSDVPAAALPTGDYMPLVAGTGWLYEAQALSGDSIGQLGYATTKVTKVDANTTKAEARRTAHLKGPDAKFVDLADDLTISKTKNGVSFKYAGGPEHQWLALPLKVGVGWSAGNVEVVPVATDDVASGAGSFKGAIKARAFVGDKPGYVYFAKDVGMVTWYNRQEPGVSFPLALALSSRGKGIGEVVIPSAEPSGSPSPSEAPSPSPSPSASPSPGPSAEPSP